MTAVSSEDVDKNLAIAESAHQLGYATLKELQVKAISSIDEGQDTFVSLPTGYGKSIIFAAHKKKYKFLTNLKVSLLITCTNYKSINHLYHYQVLQEA